MRNLFTRLDKKTVKIGDKSVTIRKVTILQWRELFSVVQTLPQLIITVLTAPASERTAYVVYAMEKSIDEIVQITSILTGLDEEYIVKNASIDELVEYFTEIVKVNNFVEMLKNVQGVLNLGSLTEEPVQSAS